MPQIGKMIQSIPIEVRAELAKKLLVPQQNLNNAARRTLEATPECRIITPLQTVTLTV